MVACSIHAGTSFLLPFILHLDTVFFWILAQIPRVMNHGYDALGAVFAQTVTRTEGSEADIPLYDRWRKAEKSFCSQRAST